MNPVGGEAGWRFWRNGAQFLFAVCATVVVYPPEAGFAAPSPADSSNRVWVPELRGGANTGHNGAISSAGWDWVVGGSVGQTRFGGFGVGEKNSLGHNLLAIDYQYTRVSNDMRGAVVLRQLGLTSTQTLGGIPGGGRWFLLRIGGGLSRDDFRALNRAKDRELTRGGYHSFALLGAGFGQNIWRELEARIWYTPRAHFTAAGVLWVSEIQLGMAYWFGK